MADEYVVFRKEDVEALAEAIRAKAGLTDKFSFPAEFIVAVNSITGSGGESYTELGNFMYRYGVASDVHISTSTEYASENFDMALSMYEKLGVNLVCISGDITDTSTIGEMNLFNSVCADHPNVSVHFCTGNHDKNVADADWQSYFGRARNYELIHNDDVFLFMSLDDGYSSSSSAYTEGLVWLRERLNRYKGARIFLFMHFPPSGYSGLVEGQYYGFSANATIDDELVTLLNTTKNVTVFHGHSHYAFDVQNHSDAMNVYRFNASDVNLIHVPSVAYTRDKDMEDIRGSECWLVDVYEKGFFITGYNIKTGEAVGYTEYIFATDNIDLPANAIVVDTIDATLRDGESVSVNVYLAEPENTTVNITGNSALTIVPSSLTFTESNYNVPQVVTITAPSSISEDANYPVKYSANGMISKTTSVTLVETLVIPMLAESSSWYKGTTPRANITTINIVDSVDSVPSTYSETWDASEAMSGTVTAFVAGTTLYIAGNGSGKIVAPRDASFLFSDLEKADLFSSVTSLNGLGLLNTSSTQYMNDMFRGLEALTEIDLSGLDTASVTRMYNMFKNCTNITSINFSGFSTARSNNMSSMFENCEKLTGLDLSGFSTSRVERMSMMFANCGSLSSINFGSNFNTANVTTFAGMFFGCGDLNALDLSGWNTASVDDMNQMFMDCTSLTSLNVSNWNTSKVDDMHEMFDHCDNLTTLNISTFDTRAIPDSEGLCRFARKSGILDLTVGEHFVQSYNMYPAGSSGMFYTESTTALTVRGANAVLKTYDFVTDHRTVTFV